jgi:hypothetical protein
MFDVDGIVEITGGFAVDGDDGKVTEIFAVLRVGFLNRFGETLGFADNLGRKNVGQVMFPDDDFDVDTEIAGAAENFDDAAGGGRAASGKAEDLDVDDGTVEFFETRNATRRARRSDAITAISGRARNGEAVLFREFGRKFVAGRNFDGVLHARVVGQDGVEARTVTEKTDDGRMRATQNAEDAPFGALRAVPGSRAENLGEDAIAVHGVFNRISGDKDIAGVLRGGNVWHDEAVAVVMEDEAAGEFVAARGRLRLSLRGGSLGGSDIGVAFLF